MSDITGQPVGLINDGRLRELSGLTASHQHYAKSILWGHNDSGGEAAIFAIDGTSGKVLAKVKIEGAKNIDWEGIGVGKATDGTWVIYIADVGDNSRTRTSVKIYQIAEPTEIRDQTVKLRKVITARYPDGKKLDCEAIIVDQSRNAGRAYLITKDTRPGVMYLLPYAGDAEMKLAATGLRQWITDAALSPDAKTLVVRSGDYFSSYRWPFDPETRYDFKCFPKQIQGEAVTFSASGKSLYLGSEGVDSLIKLPVSVILD